jgi:hypothetical protein
MLRGWLQGKNQPVPLLREDCSDKLVRPGAMLEAPRAPGRFLPFFGGNFPSWELRRRNFLDIDSTKTVNAKRDLIVGVDRVLRVPER